MPRPSIQRRLIVIMVLSQSLLALGLLLAGIFYTEKRLNASLDATMQGRMMSLAALVRFTEDANDKLYFDRSLLPSSIDPEHPDLYSVWVNDTELLARSDNWPPDLQIDLRNKHRLHFEVGGVHYRGIRGSQIPVLDREDGKAPTPATLTIVYASPTEHVEGQVYQAGLFIAFCSFVLLGCTVGLGVWGVRRGLLPLGELAREAGQVSAQQWRLRVPEDARQIRELLPLTQAMTEMLGRLERSFTQQREFMGNAAHELKTPVAI